MVNTNFIRHGRNLRYYRNTFIRFSHSFCESHATSIRKQFSYFQHEHIPNNGNIHCHILNYLFVINPQYGSSNVKSTGDHHCLSFSQYMFTKEEVMKDINTLKINRSPSVNRFSNELLKSKGEVVIYNSCATLETGSVSLK